MENKKYVAISPDGKSNIHFEGSRPTIDGNWVVFYNNDTNEVAAIIPTTYSIFLGGSDISIK